METIPLFWQIILFTLLGSVVSLAGGVLLLIKEKIATKVSHFLASFAAGAILGTAFLDLLPEALELGEQSGVPVFQWALVGILIFFLIERFIRWFHNHSYLDRDHRQHIEPINSKPTVLLITLGDSIHNFIDGVAIAATFMTDPTLGIVTTIAVAAHEIPQEIGDFGILLHRGINKWRVLAYNVTSSLMAVFGALITYYLRDIIQNTAPIVLALTAGFFIYIALSDLIPEIHNRESTKRSYGESILLLVGIMVIFLSVSYLEH